MKFAKVWKEHCIKVAIKKWLVEILIFSIAQAMALNRGYAEQNATWKIRIISDGLCYM